MSSTEVTSSREDEVKLYLEKHNILSILNDLTSALVFYRPEDPRKFLIEELTKMREAKLKNVRVPRLLDQSNANAIFDTLDPTGRGYITLNQYEETMLQLGIKQFKPFDDQDNKQITRQMFLEQFKAT